MVGQLAYHGADTNRDRKIDLAELTRFIELYNTRANGSRSGRYKLQSDTADGFAADASAAAGQALSVYHAADSNHDGQIGLLELTRVIELYNTRANSNRSGRYQVQPGTEDGFTPGP